MPFTVKTDPVVLPVTADEVKKHTVVEASADDSLLEIYLKAANIHGQILTGRQFVEATFVLDLDEFPSGKIALRPELQSVESVTYTGIDGEPATLDSSEYEVKKTGLVGFIQPVDEWPADAEDILVEFKAGWPASGGGTTEDPYVSTTPEDIKAWIMVRVADAYLQRESFILSKSGSYGVSKMPASFVDDMLACRVVPGIGAGI